MANVLNRTTHEYLQSVHTPDYDIADWVINPDVTELTGVPPKYWDIGIDDVITEMTPEQKAVVDANTVIPRMITRSQVFAFSLRHAKAKNVYLDWNGINTAPPGGAVLSRGAPQINAIEVQIANPSVGDCVFILRKNNKPSAVHQVTLPAGSVSAVFANLSVDLNESDRLQVYLSCSAAVENPACQIEISWSE